jgi:hypothetical protein
MTKKARVIAFYLPQFHPIPENDQWWGKGFTEWTNVARAKPLFRGHYQPRIPADLGFYDLRLPETREAQAELAREAGIEGFCYWHYWFTGRELLERPFHEVLKSGKPDFPFCLAWANHDWTNRSWKVKSYISKEKILMKQTYSKEDYIQHFYHLLPAFRDKRYIKVDAKPLFVVNSPLDIPDAKYFLELWEALAKENGLSGIHFVGITVNYLFKQIGKGENRTRIGNVSETAKYYQNILDMGFDAVNSRGARRAEVIAGNKFLRFIREIARKYLKIELIYRYKQSRLNKYIYVNEDKWENVYPTILPNWDSTPRKDFGALVYTGSSPMEFKRQIKKCLEIINDKNDEHKIIFLQSWNEWAEGNYMEPDLKFGKEYIKVLKDCLSRKITESK